MGPRSPTFIRIIQEGSLDNTSPVGWLCLLPPLLTIVLAIISKRVVISLLSGIAMAVLILLPAPGGTADATYLQSSASNFIQQFAEEHLWTALVDADHLRVFVFTSMLGMQIALIHRSGGMLGIVRFAAPLAKTRRGGQFLTWLLGLVVFIDDYANTLLLGSTMRPVTDRLRISREKLAFLVDSTAAPVSGLALVSTWVATEISTMQTGYENAGVDVSGEVFGLFIQTIPGRFYILYALVFVLLCSLLCRDFGPMLTAERRAQREPPPTPEAEHASSEETIKPRAINAIAPILVTIAVVVALLVQTGRASAEASSLPALSDWQAWGSIVGQGDSYLALVYGALSGLAVILALISAQRLMSAETVRKTCLEGFAHVVPALVILWLAWTLSRLTSNDFLGTGNYLASLVTSQQVMPALMPTIVFLLASGIAFSTGTSWGTMAILMPIVIDTVYKMLSNDLGSAPPVDHYLLTASIGSVLAGAIFGDHCSPISDTTILSSRSSDCDHIAHVRTQMPYAVSVGLIAIVCGTLPAGFGIGSLWLLPLGLLAMVALLLVVGRPLDTEAESPATAP